MAMSYFDGFPEDKPAAALEQPIVQDDIISNIEASEQPPVSQRDLDIAEFLAVRIRLLEQDIEGPIAPTNAELRVNVPKDPFERDYMEWRFLQQRGYGIHFVDNARTFGAEGYEACEHYEYGDFGQFSGFKEQPRRAASTYEYRHYIGGEPLSDYLAVYVDSSDVHVVDRILHLAGGFDVPEEDKQPPRHYANLLEALTHATGVHAWQFNPTNENAAMANRPLTAPEVASRIPHVLARSFLTSRMLHGLKGLTDDNDRDYWEQVGDIELYEKLSQKGHQPFNVETLYGMAAASIAFILTEYKDIPPSASKQPEEL